jgi:hypothetical protein
VYAAPPWNLVEQRAEADADADADQERARRSGGEGHRGGEDGAAS